MKEYKLLYLTPGPVPPFKDVSLSKFFALSEISEGAVLAPVWWKNEGELVQNLGAEAIPVFRIGSFKFDFFYLGKFPEWSWFIVRFIYYVVNGLKLNREFNGFDFIMTYGTNSTGLAAVVLRTITKAKLITEIPGVPEDGSLFDQETPNLLVKTKLKITNFFLNLVLLKTDHLKLLYPTQLDQFTYAKTIPRSIFHDFVPTKNIEKYEVKRGHSIILVGHPWYRKGADVLIGAFNKISSSAPDLELLIIGWLPDIENLRKIINGNEKIHLLGPLPSDKTYQLISECFALALPSRSEAMGRVLLEAMALKKPILASEVNGIPTYVRHNINGLLSKPGDVINLANNITTLYNDKDLQNKLGHEGYVYLKKELDEDAYIRKFHDMLSRIKLENK